MRYTELTKIFTRDEFVIIRGLWMQNIKSPNAEPICEDCENIWGNILIAHEPKTEYFQLSKKEKVISTELQIEEE